MQKIVSPLGPNNSGDEVGNLQSALQSIAAKSTGTLFKALFSSPQFLARWREDQASRAYGTATGAAVRVFQQTAKVASTGVVDEATARTIDDQLTAIATGGSSTTGQDQPRTVSGVVYDNWIEPMKGVPVMVFDKDIRSEHLLGEGQTDDDGNFSISYPNSRLTTADKGGANLIVRIYGSDGSPVYASPVNYNAPAALTVNVNLGPRSYLGPSQFVSVTGQVRECAGKLPIAELTENSNVHDLSYIVSKTGIAANILLQLVAAFRFEKWTGLEAEIYYGILASSNAFPAPKQGNPDLPADVDQTIEQEYIKLWATAVPDMLSDLQQAAIQNIVTYRLMARKEAIGAELQRLQTSPPQEAGGAQPLPPVYGQMNLAGLNAAQQAVFLNLYAKTGIGSSIWTTLGQDPSFQGSSGATALHKLQAVVQVGGWTGGNTALTTWLINTYSIGSLQDFGKLVANTAADWANIIQTSGADQNSALATAQRMAAGIEGLFPMAVFADRFSKASTLKMSNQAFLTGIVQSADFNLLSTPAVQYLKSYVQKNPLPTGADQNTVGRQLMSMQRVYKISRSADTSVTLLGANIQSARQVYAMGSGNFVSQFKDKLGGADVAQQVFDQAAEIHAGAAFLTGKLVSMLNNPAGAVLPDYNGQLAQSTLAHNYPDLAELFGMPPSYCACDDCSSFLGTPAYLTDLLDFLSLRQTSGGSTKANARQVLLADGRRPDIADIDLSCANANTELPYIDVVNELLEDYIIPPVACLTVRVKDLNAIEAWVKAYLKAGKISAELFKLMQLIVQNPKTPICNLSLLTPDAVISAAYITANSNFPVWIGTSEYFTDPWQWVIRDQFITLKVYLITNEQSPLFPSGGGNIRLACTDVDATKGGGGDTGTPVAVDGDKITFTLVVEEIHQTHLTTDIINTNPEYINTNVYNCLGDPFNTYKHNLWSLYPTIIPMSLPFDLYFTESNVYLNKMGVQRSNLIDIFRKQKMLGGDTLSILSIAMAYLGLAPGDAEIILVARLSEQNKFWGSLAALKDVPVNRVLTISGLTFTQLQDLLTLVFINPKGDSKITNKPGKGDGRQPVLENCNTADMLLINMTPEKFDHMNRFIRLWNKVNILTPVTMNELDDCIMSPALGSGYLNDAFAVHLYYFLNVMNLINLTATQALVLYQDIKTKGDNSLYQQLFQNREISNPLVQAFQLPLGGTTLITDAHDNPGAVAVVLTACGITSADLSAIMALNNQAYAKLNLDNLSFIYACGLIANALSISVSDLLTLTGLLNSNPLRAILGAPVSAATPKSTFDFISAFNAVQQAGFDVDQLNYALTCQSTATPSLVPAASDVVSGLTGIRSAIQAAVTATTPAPDPTGSLLKKWLADPDLNWDPGIAASLTAILGTAGTANYEVQVQDNLRFLQLLQEDYEHSAVTAYLSALPPVSFPDSSIGTIAYDNTKYYLFYYGTMTASLHNFLRSAAPDAISQTAVDELYTQSQGCPLSAVLLPTATLGTPPIWVGTVGQNVPAFSGGTGVLAYTGPMAGPDYSALLAQSADPTYGCALTQLFLASQGAGGGVQTFVQLAALPAIGLPDQVAASLDYNATAGTLSITGSMSAADAQALLGLAADPGWQSAIAALYTTAVAGQTISVPLAALPAGWTSFPDLTGIDGLFFSPGTLQFTGSMTTTERSTLTGLSTDPGWYDAINLLYLEAATTQASAQSSAQCSATQPVVTAVPLNALPAGVSLPVAGIGALSWAPPALCYTGQMNSPVQSAFDNLSTDPTWANNIKALLTNGQSAVVATEPITALPSGLTAASFPLYGVSYTPPIGANPATLGYAGPMSDYVLALLIAANADPNWAAAVTALYQNAQDSLVSAVQLVLPAGLSDASFAGITGITSVTTAGITVLSSAGQLSTTTRQLLLGKSQDPAYVAAVGYLFTQTSAIIPASLPVIGLPDANIQSVTYTPGAIGFKGTPNYDSMDEFNLQGLSGDPAYQGAIGWIYNAPPAPAIPAGSVGATLAELPAITLPTTLPVTWSGGELAYVGQMSAANYGVLKNLSSDLSWQTALGDLDANSQITSVARLNLAALPPGVTVAGLQSDGVVCQQSLTGFVLSYTGVMSGTTESALLTLSADSTYIAAIKSLFLQSQTVVQTTVPLAALPPVTIPAGLSTTYDSSNGVLYYSGALPMPAPTLTTLQGLSTAPEYLQALTNIASVTANAYTYLVFAPPPPVAWPALASGTIGYAQGGTVGFTATMSFADFSGLLGLSTDPAYRAALCDLFVRSQTSGGSIIQSTNPLALPPLAFPAMYGKQLSYSTTTHMLTLRGMIATADESALLSYSSNAAYQQAIDTVFDAASPGGTAYTRIPDLYETLWPMAYGALTPAVPGDLYAFFLEAISIVYQPIKQAEALAAQISAGFSVSAAVAAVLVADLGDLFDQMTMPSFAGNSKAINPDPNQCPQSLWYVKLARIGFLVNAFSLGAADTDWLLHHAGSIGAIDLTFYPGPAKTVLPFSAWTVSNGLSTFEKTYRPMTISDPANPGETLVISVYSIITGAQELKTAPPASQNPGSLLEHLELLTGWDNRELLYLLAIGEPDLPDLLLNPLDLNDTGNPAIGCATDMDNIAILLRLSACFTIATQMKVVPSRCVGWITDPLTDITAVDIKQALKSQYPDPSTWPNAIIPLTNTLRQERRDALVAYLLSDPVSNVWGVFQPFTDEFAMYGNFLIDVEMGACQPTTRIIQAYCSIQLFVQRIFLSLEPGLVPNVDADPYWAEWAWMGTAEGWFAARYTFLYPENLVLPQTLPNQTSFFQDFQNALTQGPVTSQIVETAFEGYIESLDEVARLQVRGQWYDDSTGNLHVFACTYGGNPQVYYYRMLNAFQQWGPWQQVTADISGDQLIPVMQNGRLYLYWPVFTQTSDDDTTGQSIPSSSSGGTAPPPSKYWEIQMAFCEYINGQWSGKKISKGFLVSSTIIFTPGKPTLYPDTTDFVFVPLDIPPANPGDPVAATISALEVNNTMVIACLQNFPDNDVATISVLTPIGAFNFNVNVNPNTGTMELTDLTGQLASAVSGASNSTYTLALTFNHQPTGAVYLGGNGAVNLFNAINDLGPMVNVTISGTTVPLPFPITISNISYSKTENSDCLVLLAEPGLNAFLLDPLRGYPTPVDLSSIRDTTGDFLHYWFDGSGFVNNLVEGQTPLVNNWGSAILKPKDTFDYSNLLALQMGLWAKFDCLDLLNGTKVNLNTLGTLMPWFYQDTARTFFVDQATDAIPLQGVTYATYEEVAVALTTSSMPSTIASEIKSVIYYAIEGGPYYQFSNFYHPFAHYFIRIVAQHGMAGIVTRPIQLCGDPNDGSMTEVKNNLIHAAGYKDFSFSSAYGPQSNVVNINNTNYAGGYPVEQMDFDPGSAYSQYNWELFFHSVMLSGIQLSQNQQFAEADACFRMILNTTDASTDPSPRRYWVTKPFYKNNADYVSIEDWITLYTLAPNNPFLQAFKASVNMWKLDPYDPHMLALYRVTPYMYATFMQYLNNLIAWANFNYAQYTMESVNFAIQLFMLALEMLGTMPEEIPPVVEEPVCTYNQLESNLDQQIQADGEGYLSDPLVQVENLLPPPGKGGGGGGKQLQMLKALYFCIPPNPVLLSYWGTIETQLTKIRNCMNIQGQFQPLSPFPNIPGAGNMDGSGIADFGGVLPNYRFAVMIQKATEFCNEVKGLGSALLQALEKQDAEGLALLHAAQEVAVQQAIDQVKQMQIQDAQLGYQNLLANQQLINDKITYYGGLIQNGGLIPLEQQALTLNQFSLAMEAPITAGTILASVLKLIPSFQLGAAGFGGSPTVNASIGGAEFGGAVDAFVQFMSFLSHFADKSAAIATTNASYTRRLAEWTFQLGQANDELAANKVQLQSQQEKIDIAVQEEKNQQLLITNAQAVQTFLEDKYTNQQLYSWMVTQISNVYFQSYQLAYNFAKQAEVCFGYELGITGASYISYGYWDSLHKGLLSGEGLMTSLKRMEADYYNLNIREYELTRRISLAQFDPVALLQLKTTGSCFINIPEQLFDLDYPGHYFRRIKRVTVTLPGVVGPYTPVCIKMTLLSNSVRVDNTPGTPRTYARNTDSKGNPTYDSRFLDNYAAMQYIATSTGVNDSGLFELNLKDERYLPFERAGVIATWQIEFTSIFPQFDRDSVTDFVLDYGYTSRDGGALFQAVAAESVQSQLKTAMTNSGLTLMRGFDARRDFPSQWYKFLNPANPADLQSLVMDITDRWPFFTNGLTVKISHVVMVAQAPPVNNGAARLSNLYLSGNKLSNALVDFGQNPEFGPNTLYALMNCKDSPGVWTITNGTAAAPATTAVTSTDIEDLFIIFYYTLS
jgi:hypothetical protein